MQIISWNCKYFWSPRFYGFSDFKYNKLVTEYPNNDILIIQEITYQEYIQIINKYGYIFSDWYCDGKNSITGIAIFSNKYKIEKLVDNTFNLPFRYIIPYKIIDLDNRINEYILFSVWTKEYIKNDKLHKYDYVENLIEAVKYYKKINLLNEKTIIIGDFNSATTKVNIYESHKILENLLKELNFSNCSILNNTNMEYDITYIDNYGNGFTNDYCFISNEIVKNKTVSFKIGNKEIWINSDLSDHCPIIVEFTSLRNSEELGPILDINSEESRKQFEEWFLNEEVINLDKK